MYQEQSEEETEKQGLGERGWERKARSRRGSGFPLIKRFPGALMRSVKENYHREMPGHALPISEWVWLGSWTEASRASPYRKTSVLPWS